MKLLVLVCLTIGHKGFVRGYNDGFIPGRQDNGKADEMLVSGAIIQVSDKRQKADAVGICARI